MSLGIDVVSSSFRFLESLLFSCLLSLRYGYLVLGVGCMTCSIYPPRRQICLGKIVDMYAQGTFLFWIFVARLFGDRMGSMKREI